MAIKISGTNCIDIGDTSVYNVDASESPKDINFKATKVIKDRIIQWTSNES